MKKRILSIEDNEHNRELATSRAMPGDRERCLEAGCNGYMEKPIDPRTCATRVGKFVETRP